MTSLLRLATPVLTGTLLLTAATAAPALAQSSEDIQAVMRVEIEDEAPMDIEYALGDGRMRMNMGSEMSVVAVNGDDPTMLMIQHPQERYIEWGDQQMQMMQRMMGQLGAGGGAAEVFDPGLLTFETTGQTGMIGPWDAFEVVMTSDEGEEGILWLSTDAEVGLFELALRAADAATMLSNPMAGGGGAAQQLLQYQSLAEAQGLPDGRVVQIVAPEDDGGTTVTLMSAETGPLPAGTFDAPDGYERMEMPALPNIPGLPD